MPQPLHQERLRRAREVLRAATPATPGSVRLERTPPTAPTRVTRLPKGATVDEQFVDAALNYRRCNREYMKASAAWADFAARNGYEDPAHADHHTKRIQTRRALDGADEALSIAEEKLLGARS